MISQLEQHDASLAAQVAAAQANLASHQALLVPALATLKADSLTPALMIHRVGSALPFGDGVLVP